MRQVVVTSITLYPDQMERVDAVALARRTKRAAVIRELVEIGLPSIERVLDTDDRGTVLDAVGTPEPVEVSAA